MAVAQTAAIDAFRRDKMRERKHKRIVRGRLPDVQRTPRETAQSRRSKRP